MLSGTPLLVLHLCISSVILETSNLLRTTVFGDVAPSKSTPKTEVPGPFETLVPTCQTIQHTSQIIATFVATAVKLKSHK
jgi:hypothetical protein